MALIFPLTQSVAGTSIDSDLTKDIILYETSTKANASDRIEGYSIGLKIYPDDPQLIEELNRSARSLITWAKGKHNEGSFDTATNRYDFLLSTPYLYEEIKKEVVALRSYSVNSKTIPSVELLLKRVDQVSIASDKLEILHKAYLLHPENDTIKNNIDTYSSSLINWSRQQQNAGDFSRAIDRYEFILNSPYLDPLIELEVLTRLDYARNSRSAPGSATLINQIKLKAYLSEQLEGYEKAYALYPNNSMISDLLNSTAISLMNWAEKKVNAGDYSVAIDRYLEILNTNGIYPNTRDNVKNKATFAFDQKAKSYSTASQRISIYNEALEIFPENQFLKEGLSTSNLSLFNWAEKTQKSFNFENSSDRYAFILNSQYIDIDFKIKVKYHFDYSIKSQLTPEQYYDNINSLSTSSERVEGFVKGLDIYGDLEIIFKGLDESVESLLLWTKGQVDIGNIEVAIDRYEFLLSIDKLTNISKERVVNQYKSVLLNKADNTTDPIDKLDIYLKGIEIDPTDVQFQNRIVDLVPSLKEIGVNRHVTSDFIGAVEIYEVILSLPVNIDELVRSEIEIRLSYAEDNLKIPTAESLLSEAGNQSESSNRLLIYSKGYLLYPNNLAFEEGINNSARSLLNWASGKHNEGDFETAIVRYERILNVPILNNTLKQETEYKLLLAKEKTKFDSFDIQLNLALSLSNASDRLTIYYGMYSQYPNNNQLVNQINNSAKSLLNWASNKHESKEFAIAIERYNHILKAPILDEFTRRETEIKLDYAQKSSAYPVEIEYINLALKESLASNQLRILTEGLYVHKNSLALQRELDNSAISLMNWSIKQHNSGNFSTAEDRYETIINNPFVSNPIKSEVEHYLELAKNKQTIEEQNSTKYDLTIDQMLDIQMSTRPQTNGTRKLKGYVREDLLTLDNSNTSKGIINTSGVNVREGAGTSSVIIGSLNQGTTVNVIKKVDGIDSNDKYQWYQIEHTVTGWINATREEVRVELLPSNTQDFQHLILSEPAGASIQELSAILNGQGSLSGTERAFYEASRQYGINEIYLIAHAFLETGYGSSTLAKGVKHSSGKTVYNMFGIAAYDNSAIVSATEYAYRQGWFTPEAAVKGGAEWIAQNYVNSQRYNQNTVYKMRWNPSNSTNTDRHQYATDIGWARKIANIIERYYKPAYSNRLDLVEYK